MGHNCNLTNTAELAAGAGMLPGTVTTDSDLVAELIASAFPSVGRGHSDGRDLKQALVEVHPSDARGLDRSELGALLFAAQRFNHAHAALVVCSG